MSDNQNNGRGRGDGGGSVLVTTYNRRLRFLYFRRFEDNGRIMRCYSNERLRFTVKSNRSNVVIKRTRILLISRAERNFDF